MGAGSVGCYVGGWLAGSAEVTLVGRAAVLDAIEADGLTVTDLAGRSRTTPADRLTLCTEASSVMGADVVLLTTKSADTASAAAQVAPFLSVDTVVISLQNGLTNASLVEAQLGGPFPSRAQRPLVLSGMVPYNIVRTAPATWTQTVSGTMVVKDHPRVDPFVAAAREAGFRIDVHPDMRAVLFAKLLLNLNNAVNALSGRPLAEELRDRDYRRVLAACQDEALAVARAASVSPARLTPLPPVAMPALLRTPTPVFATVARTQLTISPDARSSMADDLDAGRRTEIGQLQGAVVELGERYGVPTPVSHAIVTLVREAEAAGPDRHRWGGAELRRAVTVPA